MVELQLNEPQLTDNNIFIMTLLKGFLLTFCKKFKSSPIQKLWLTTTEVHLISLNIMTYNIIKLCPGRHVSCLVVASIPVSVCAVETALALTEMCIHSIQPMAFLSPQYSCKDCFFFSTTMLINYIMSNKKMRNGKGSI